MLEILRESFERVMGPERVMSTEWVLRLEQVCSALADTPEQAARLGPSLRLCPVERLKLVGWQAAHSRTSRPDCHCHRHTREHPGPWL